MPVEITARKKPFRQRLRRDMRENWVVYLLLLPVIIWYIIFCYLPMFGIVMAFENFKFAKGLFGSAWVGFRNFEKFFSSYYFWRLLRNTLTLSIKDLIFSFPAPIIFALMLNELRSRKFKKSIQTISYLPYFISMVVVCGMVKTFQGTDFQPGILPRDHDYQRNLAGPGIRQRGLYFRPNGG